MKQNFKISEKLSIEEEDESKNDIKSESAKTICGERWSQIEEIMTRKWSIDPIHISKSSSSSDSSSSSSSEEGSFTQSSNEDVTITDNDYSGLIE